MSTPNPTPTGRPSTMSVEPAVVTSVIVGVIGLVAPSIALGPDVKTLITGIVTLAVAVAGGFHIRGKVTPTSVLAAAKDEAHEAVVSVQMHPEQVSAIVNEIQTSLAAMTTGPHPATLEPGADSTEPEPQPQGTYDAHIEPAPALGTGA